MSKFFGGINPFGGPGNAFRTGATIANGFNRHMAERRMAEAARREAERQNAILTAPPDVHGSARWANASELAQSGYLRSVEAYDNPSSILLGAFMEGEEAATPAKGWLHWDGEGHLLTVAPTRTGKSMTLIVPNLLRYRGSAVVLDPKGELYERTSAWRSTLGPVFRIAPFDDQSGFPRHAFNPLSTVKSGADARALADLMIPTDQHAQSFFKNDAVNFLNGVIQFVQHHAPTDRRTFNEVRRLIAQPAAKLAGILDAMEKSPTVAIRNAAIAVGSKSKDRGLPTLKDTLNSALGVWDDPNIIEATSGNQVDFSALKDGTATIYVTVPFHMMEAFTPFLKVVLTSALEAMIQNPVVPKIPVLFVLDEFLQLGSFEKFLQAVNTHASAGVRLWFFLQNLARLEDLYPTSWRNFLDASVRIFFGTRDGVTARLISDDLGERTAAWRTTSASLSSSSTSGNFGMDHSTTSGVTLNSSVNLTGRRLLDPAEVMRKLDAPLPDGSRHGIIFMSGRPILGRMVPYTKGTRTLQRIGAFQG